MFYKPVSSKRRQVLWTLKTYIVFIGEKITNTKLKELLIVVQQLNAVFQVGM